VSGKTGKQIYMENVKLGLDDEGDDSKGTEGDEKVFFILMKISTTRIFLISRMKGLLSVLRYRTKKNILKKTMQSPMMKVVRNKYRQRRLVLTLKPKRLQPLQARFQDKKKDLWRKVKVRKSQSKK